MDRAVRICIGLLLALAPLAYGATPTLVGTPVHNSSTSSTTCAATISSVTANDTLIYEVFESGTSVLSSIADNTGGTGHVISAAITFASGTSSSFGLYYVQAAASGSHTITATIAAANGLVCFMSEWSGISTTAAFDKATSISYGSTASISAPSITPTNAGELLIFGIGQGGIGGTYSSYTPSSTFVQQDTANTGPEGAWASYVQPTAAAITAGVTSTKTNASAAAVAAFVAASGGSSCTHAGLTSGGAISVPTAGSTVVRLKNGSFGTVDCSTTQYFQPTLGNFGTN